jgi:hypothetical protein
MYLNPRYANLAMPLAQSIGRIQEDNQIKHSSHTAQ